MSRGLAAMIASGRGRPREQKGHQASLRDASILRQVRDPWAEATRLPAGDRSAVLRKVQSSMASRGLAAMIASGGGRPREQMGASGVAPRRINFKAGAGSVG